MEQNDVKSIVDNWTKQVDELSEIINEFSKQVIYIDIDKKNAENNDKFKRIKQRWDLFCDNINKRIEKLREKIISQLNKIYTKATQNLEPWKSIFDALSALANLKISLTTIVDVVVGIIKALLGVAKLFYELYLNALKTVLAIIVLIEKVITITLKLTTINKLPKVIFRNGETWSPTLTAMKPITLAEITGGSISSEQDLNSFKDEVNLKINEYNNISIDNLTENIEATQDGEEEPNNS